MLRLVRHFFPRALRHIINSRTPVQLYLSKSKIGEYRSDRVFDLSDCFVKIWATLAELFQRNKLNTENWCKESGMAEKISPAGRGAFTQTLKRLKTTIFQPLFTGVVLGTAVFH